MFTLDQFPLKYSKNALEPNMSEQTINFHYGKHFDAYIKNLNNLITGTEYEKMELEDIIKKSAKSEKDKKIFNNAAQVFNHNFFFLKIAKDSGTKVPEKIAKAFNGADKFLADFSTAAMSVFGSGWVWLSDDGGKLKIEVTANADNPLAHGRTPILTLDVWEHSYYLDYQNRRADYVDSFLKHLVNWDLI